MDCWIHSVLDPTSGGGASAAAVLFAATALSAGRGVR